MDEFVHFVKYSALALVTVFIYSLHLKKMIDALCIFIFAWCIIMLIILISYKVIRRKHVFFRQDRDIFDTGFERAPDIFPKTLIENYAGEERYFVQEKFAELGIKGQQQLSRKRVVVFGLGVQGTIAAELLCRLGIGKLRLIDETYVEDDLLYLSENQGRPISMVLMDRLKSINSSIDIEAYHAWIQKDNLTMLDSDLVIDCTNIGTRISDYCRKNKIPLICARHSDKQGYVKITKHGSCGPYPKDEAPGMLLSTAHLGASVQITLALKLLLGKSIQSDLVSFNTMQFALKTR